MEKSLIVIAVFIWFWVVLGVIFLICYGIYSLINSVGLPKKIGYGILIDKKFIPRHTTTIMTYSPVMKMVFPQIMHHSDKWTFKFEIDGNMTYGSFNEDIFGKTIVNEQYKLIYSEGRINKKNKYIRSIEV